MSVKGAGLFLQDVQPCLILTWLRKSPSQCQAGPSIDQGAAGIEGTVSLGHLWSGEGGSA